MNVYIFSAICFALVSAVDFDTKLFKPSFYQTTIQEKLQQYWNLASQREDVSKAASKDSNKDFYLNEDFNWDSVDDTEWDKWDETHVEVPHLRQLSSLDIIDHYLNSREHRSLYFESRKMN